MARSKPGTEEAPPPPPRLDRQRVAELRSRLAGVGMAAAMDLRIEELVPGRCTMVLPVSPQWKGAFGSFHGGAVAALIDTAAAFALRTLLPDSVRFATIALDVQYLTRASSDLRAVATVEKVGSRQHVVRVEVADAEGELSALGTATFLSVSWPHTGGRGGVTGRGKAERRTS